MLCDHTNTVNLGQYPSVGCDTTDFDLLCDPERDRVPTEPYAVWVADYEVWTVYGPAYGLDTMQAIQDYDSLTEARRALENLVLGAPSWYVRGYPIGSVEQAEQAEYDAAWIARVESRVALCGSGSVIPTDKSAHTSPTWTCRNSATNQSEGRPPGRPRASGVS